MKWKIKYKRLTEHQMHKITTDPHQARHIIMKMPNIQNKDSILKVMREKHRMTYKGKPIPISSDFSAQILKARRAWNNIFQALKEHSCQPRILYPAKLTSDLMMQ